MDTKLAAEVGLRAGVGPKQLPSLQLTWHLWEGTWKIEFLLERPPFSGREGT